MKELSIEEKAKRYDEAIEIAKEINNEQRAQPFNVMTRVFPELAESEDERIRKEMIETLKNEAHEFPSSIIAEKSKSWIALLEKQAEQKSAWSEDDERTLSGIYQLIDFIPTSDTPFSKEQKDICLVWLKSLKYRVLPQPKQEWSKEDIDMIDWLIRCCEKEHEELCNDRYGHQDIVSDLKRDCRKKWDWLESLKNKAVPQSQWKPSIAQLNALSIVSKGNAPDDIEAIVSLYQDLKKLREE